MPTTTRTVFLTDENGNALIDTQGNMRALSFSLVQGYSYRLVERASIVSATYAQVVGYSTATGQTIAGVENASEFDVGDFGIVQYAISDRNNTIGYVTCKVTAVGTDSLTVNGIGISVAGADGAPGADGASGVTDVTAGTPTEQDGYTVTPVTFDFEQGNSKTVEIKAKNGEGGGGSSTSNEVIDLGTVTLTGTNEELSGTVTVTSEQFTKMKAETPPIVNFEWRGDTYSLSRFTLTPNVGGGRTLIIFSGMLAVREGSVAGIQGMMLSVSAGSTIPAGSTITANISFNTILLSN